MTVVDLKLNFVKAAKQIGKEKKTAPPLPIVRKGRRYFYERKVGAWMRKDRYDKSCMGF